MAENAEDLSFDADRLAVYGGSAGGGLTIAAAMLARDRGGPSLRFMLPIYPMIDDRHVTASSQEIVDIGIWDREGNVEAWSSRRGRRGVVVEAWSWYLGGQEADQYAASARAEDIRSAGDLHRRRHH